MIHKYIVCFLLIVLVISGLSLVIFLLDFYCKLFYKACCRLRDFLTKILGSGNDRPNPGSSQGSGSGGNFNQNNNNNNNNDSNNESREDRNRRRKRDNKRNSRARTKAEAISRGTWDKLREAENEKRRLRRANRNAINAAEAAKKGADLGKALQVARIKKLFSVDFIKNLYK